MLAVVRVRELGRTWQSQGVKTKQGPEPKLSRHNLGQKAEKLFYEALSSSSKWKLVPFHIIEPLDSKGSSLSRGGGSHKGRDSDLDDFGLDVDRGEDDRKLVKFQKSWELWAYYIMSIFYVYANLSRLYAFVKPIAMSGRLKIDLYFAGDMFFFAANGFSAVFKVALAFSSSDLIFLINEIEKSIGRMRRSVQNSDRRNSKYPMQKYCWFFSVEGQAGIWSTLVAGIGAQLALTVVAFFAVDRKMDSNWDILRIILQFLEGTLVAYLDILLCVDSCFLVTVLIISNKIQLVEFESFCQVEAGGMARRSKLQNFLQHYKRLQVCNAYGNGYFRVLFPGYIGILQADVIALIYVSLTGHKYLPMFIYWTFPVASIFIFFILICLLLSQVGNIFRQSQEACSLLKHELAVEFQDRFNQIHHNNNNDHRHLDHMTTEREKRFLWRSMRTIRPFGFYSGFYGAIDQNTPASMTANICNCLILLLSHG